MLSSTFGTGGDVLGYEILTLAKKDSTYKTLVSTPKCAKKGFSNYKTFDIGLNIIDKHFFKFDKVYTYFFAYIGRTLEFLRKYKRLDLENIKVLYSPGDFFVNVIPAVFLKRKIPKSTLAVMIFHINKSPFVREVPFLQGSISYLSQRVSFYFIKRHADVVFVLSDLVKKELLSLGFKNKIASTGAGLHTNEFTKNLKSQKSFSQRRNDLVFFNRLDYTKGIFDLPKILANVKKKNPNVTLHIIGSGKKTITDELKQEFKNYGCLGSVTFYGYVKKKTDVYKILGNSKIFLQPSFEEGWSIVLHEAILCGCIPVVYDLPIYKEIFGLLIIKSPVKNFKHFSNNVNKTLLLKERERKKHLKPLFIRAREFDWTNVYSTQMNFIKKAQSDYEKK